jgi:HupE / UreJ protein
MTARAILTLLIALISPAALAHSGSASYVRVLDSSDGFSIAVSLDLRDVEYAVGVDLNRDQQITWGELLAQQAALESYVGARLQLSRGGVSCSIEFKQLKVDQLNGATYAVTEGSSACPAHGALELRSNMMFDLDAGHRSVVEWTHGDQVMLAVLTESRREWHGETELGFAAQLLAFALEGMLHIWSGLDHLAFLLILLLPAFIVNARGARNIAWRNLLGIITAFTVAHSLTLALAVTGVVSVSAMAVEIGIAASVVIAALTNLLPQARSIGMPTAFAFGLLHGFGFASALDNLGTASSFATALAGFNLGVEMGQLAVVAAVFPLVYWICARPCYAARVVPAVSLLVATLGAFWVWERVP